MLDIILNTAPPATNNSLFTTGDYIALGEGFITLLGIFITIFILINKGLVNKVLKNKTIDDLLKSNKEINDSIGKINTSIKELEISNTRIISGLLTVGCDPVLIKVKSPIKLTSLGEEILKDITGQSYIDNNIQDLLQKIKNLNPKSELDVENFSKQVLFDEFDSDKFIPIKNFIYNNPVYKEVTLNQAAIINIMGIYLRDKYLTAYPMNPPSQT